MRLLKSGCWFAETALKYEKNTTNSVKLKTACSKILSWEAGPQEKTK